MKNPRMLLLLTALGISLLAASCEHRDYDHGYRSHHRTSGVVVSREYRPGYYTQALPPRYETVNYGGYRYYRHNNVYYRPQGRGYVVVESPGGRISSPRQPGYRGGSTNVSVIRTLPRGYRTVNYGGVRYYQHGDAYYQPVSGGYRVVASPYGNRRWR